MYIYIYIIYNICIYIYIYIYILLNFCILSCNFSLKSHRSGTSGVLQKKLFLKFQTFPNIYREKHSCF